MTRMTNTSETIQSIARELFDARVGVYTVPYVSPRLPERDLDAAYAISAEFAALRERHLGVRRVGRKVGLTNPNVQKRVGISEPDYGIIHDDMIFQSGVVLPKSRYNRLRIEAEVAFVLKSDILDATLEAVAAAIDYVTQIGLQAIADYENELLEYATQQALTIDGLALIGSAQQKSAILSFTLKRIHPHDIGTLLDSQGIAIRAGHHCAMPVMDFFKVPATARASFAMYNTHKEIDRLIQALLELIKLFA